MARQGTGHRGSDHLTAIRSIDPNERTRGPAWANEASGLTLARPSQGEAATGGAGGSPAGAPKERAWPGARPGAVRLEPERLARPGGSVAYRPSQIGRASCRERVCQYV